MRNPTLFVLALVIACSGRSTRSEYESDPGTGGKLGAAGVEAPDDSSGGDPSAGGRKSAAGGSKAVAGNDGIAASGGSDGVAARGGDGAGATAASDGSGATAASDGSGATGATDSTGGTSSTGAQGGTGGTNPVTSCNDEFAFLGTWTGNLLDFYFEPMDPMRLEFGADDDGTVHGTMTIGEAEEPLPPPVDGNTPYPPGYWEDTTEGRGGGSSTEAWPGFPYTVVRGAGCDNTLRFGISTAELFDEWCSMMTPVYTDEDFGWGCILQGGGSLSQTECVAQTNDGRSATYPPWKCYACGIGRGGVCACDESGCFANPEVTRTFDLSLSESDGKSVLSGPDDHCGDCTIRLTRNE